MDSDGNTVEFMFSPSRDATSAGYPLGAFFREALHARDTVAPHMINVDRNATYPKAVAKLKRKGTLPPGCELQPIKYLNNLIEQDHRFIKRGTNPGMSFWSFETAWRTLQGYEAMHQLRKGQVQGTSRGNIKSQVRFMSTALGLAA